MSNSYRIRTTPGVDKSLKVSIDQEFEYLEILSLKLLQDQIYTRQCSDYGVVIGRVSVNNGLGLPNARVSVFIPLTEQDADNPVISEIYPYRVVSDQNEDGYRYNLLPYVPSYNGHVSTGTFFDRQDVITDPTLVEVYDKYYKYTTVTNDSGDFMLFGVPNGPQTLFVDMDLSDIGEFSLTPNDLIAMGVATPAMVDGINFKSSTNLNSLPQILTFTRNIEVEPLWGEPELCSIGITRTDFDITEQSNIRINPVAIFMGSMISDIDESSISIKCKPKKKMGNQCALVTGSGQIQAIRQTINLDEKGRPALENFKLDNGGQVIDEDGVWMINVPMNLDYVTTNEFGQQVISTDPSIGIPTKAKYRFKVKWNQSPSLSTPIRRGYYLVPNIREYGWTHVGAFNNSVRALSYAFTTNWDNYGDDTTTLGQQMINDAIDCKDKFYEMVYNKVYTVSSLISQYRQGVNKKKFIGIKFITETTCESENVKFPINDGQHQPDTLYTLFMIFMVSFFILFFAILGVLHILKLIACILFPIIAGVLYVIGGIIWLIGAIIDAIPLTGNAGKKVKDSAQGIFDAAKAMVALCTEFRIHACLLSYPDCESCEKGMEASTNLTPPPNETTDSMSASQQELGTSGVISKFYDTSSYVCGSQPLVYAELLAGKSDKSQGLHRLVGTIDRFVFSSSLTLSNRLNLFNTKAKYFNSTVTPGGGVNQIKVTFDVDMNNSGSTWHLDNLICIPVDEDFISKYEVGGIYTFTNPTKSMDVNLTGATTNIYATNSITGSTIGTPTSIDGVNLITRQVSYADPNNNGTISPPNSLYTLTAFTEDVTYSIYPMDIEYFQVIKIQKISDFLAAASTSLPNSLPFRFISNNAFYLYIDEYNCSTSNNFSPVNCYTSFNNQSLMFMVRGVDPNTSKRKCSYDLSKIYGHSSFGNNSSIVVGDFNLNVPIQGKLRNVKHDSSAILANSYATDTYSNQTLFYDSYQYLPGNQFSAFTTTMTKYYSSLDESHQSLTPALSTTIPSSGGISAWYLNDMCKEWNIPIGPSSCYEYDFVYNSQTTVNNRGYFQDEQVEGGSVLSLKVTLRNPLSTLDPTDTTSLYSRIYGTLNMSFKLGPSGRQIVMRSDRLPSSSAELNNSGNNYVFMENGNLMIYEPNGGGDTITYNVSQPSFESNFEDTTEDFGGSDILTSLQCDGMVPLECYDNNDNGSVTLKPANDSCYTSVIGKKPIMEGGCYVFVRIPVASMFEDFFYLTQWYKRQTILYGICREVFSFMFTNNWINGTLYAFPFKNTTFFDDEANPFSRYCTDTLFFDNTNNNYYYRSSPYTNEGNFVGQDSGNNKGNKRNLMFPTTMMDLGPKQKFLEEVSLSNRYKGYVMDKLNPTSYNGIEELLSLYVTLRMSNSSNLGGINSFFSRPKQGIDGDLAQMLSINSEMGVYPFQPGYYSGNSIFSFTKFGKGSNFGVFYQTDLQARDYITPKRIIYTGTGNLSTECGLESIDVFSQEVPFYQWAIKQRNGFKNNVFGTQDNDWNTDGIAGGNVFFKHKYQDLDRLEKTSRYFRTTNQNRTDYFKGYIYSVNSSGQLSPEITNWNKNSPSAESITVGAPYHFYFGLKQGKTAYDKFAESWMDFDDIKY